jgi:transcriptional regulator with XRE-family HTH domain
VTVRRPGRTQRIAVDETPLNAANPNIDARIGWLLAMSRLHHPDETFQDGRRFAEALGDAGFPASRSLLSRWESGEIPISYEGMTAYELVLGLEVGQISSITGYIKASIPAVKTRVIRPKLDPTTREFADRLDELLDAAETGTAPARDWQELGWHLAAAPMVHLRKHTWETLSRRIVQMLPRSIKVTYRQLSTAAMNMAAIPRAQDFMVDAIAQYISDPGVQVITTPAGLLDRLPTRQAARLVLEIIEKPQNSLTFATGVWLATQKVIRRDFDQGERTELDMLVLSAWRRNPTQAGEELAELIAELPEGMRETLVEAAAKAGRRKLGYVVQHGEELVASKSEQFSHDLAGAARERAPQEPTYDEDQMLTRLIREALFHRDSERRHLAGLLISSSPFGAGVTDELLLRLAGPWNADWIRARLSTLVRYLSNDSHRMRMLGFVDDPSDEVATPMTQGLGHLGLNPMSDQAIRNSLGKEWSPRERAKMYALGMSGSPGLLAISKSKDAAVWQQSAARWWLEQGPAVKA